MELSAAGLELLKRSEGFRDETYLDVAGLLTIGFGHKIGPHESYPNGITPAQGEQILADDVTDAELAVERLVKVELTQGQFDALVDFVFNLGAGRLASSTLLQMLNVSQYDQAALQLLLWDHAHEGGHMVELDALKARRRAEFNLWHGSVPEASAA